MNINSNDGRKFVREVKSRAHLNSDGAAIHCIRATLATLAEYLSPQSATQLAAQLPVEFRSSLNNSEDVPQQFSLKRFFHRVSLKEDGSLLSSIFHARCVLEVIAERVPAARIVEIHDLLPMELSSLFEDRRNILYDRETNRQPMATKRG